jgi:hypothetical protein
MLRRITLGDESLLTGPEPSWEGPGTPRLDARSRALVRLGALIASDPTPATLQHGIAVAIGSDVSTDECVEALVELLPTIGLPRAAAVAPKLGLAIGYDVDAALEAMSEERLGRPPAAR